MGRKIGTIRILVMFSPVYELSLFPNETRAESFYCQLFMISPRTITLRAFARALNFHVRIQRHIEAHERYHHDNRKIGLNQRVHNSNYYLT